MRHWGVVVSAFYILLIACFAPAIAVALVTEVEGGTLARMLRDLREVYVSWQSWGFVLLLALGPLLLVLLRVDQAKRIPRRTAPIAISAIAIGHAFALLAGFAVAALTVATLGDSLEAAWTIPTIAAWAISWLFWAILLWRQADRLLDPSGRAFRLLIAGSALQLLVVVPSHIVVRARHECSAPLVTSCDIATGLAILLMSIGPGAWFLYRTQIARRRATSSAAPPPPK